MHQAEVFSTMRTCLGDMYPRIAADNETAVDNEIAVDNEERKRRVQHRSPSAIVRRRGGKIGK